ncbi:Syntaxin-binding protein 5 [Bienertia sinuspersici]
MFAKLFNKQSSDSQESKSLIDLNPQVIAHYGIPSTASRLAYDPIQQLLAIGTLDGRIKVIGSNNIEGLLTSPKEIPFKNLEFLQNQGFLIGVTNDNDVQVWDLEHRTISSMLQWETNITAFSVIQETNYMYLGDDCGLVSVLKYDIEEKKILRQQYSIPIHSVFEAAGIPQRNNQSVVGVLSQPCSGGFRVLLAYDNGVIVLWDVTKDQMLRVRGWTDHQVNDGDVDYSISIQNNEEKVQGDKDIISLCWASSDGSILAVGYVDGDIMLWNLSNIATSKDHKNDNVVKLQLSSAQKRFPVIVLHWSASGVHENHGGQLFVYGGDEIGSSEVLTILNLEWSSKKDALKNVVRANVTLQGSFADMILLQSFSVAEDTGNTSLILLTSPGQLQYYDSPCLSGLISDQDKSCTIPLLYRSVVPTSEPYLTVGRFISVLGNKKCFAALSEMASTVELQETYPSSDKISKWPLNGGVPCHLSLQGERKVERLYIAGYQDGTVRMWDATYPILSPIFVLNPEVRGITNAGAEGSVSALDFCPETLNVAIGNGSGTVHLHSVITNFNETRLQVVSGIKNESEVCDSDQGIGSNSSTVFTLSTSPVITLRYITSGARLAVGYKSGQVAMLNTSSSSVLFLVDTLSGPGSHVVSFSPAISLETYGLPISLDQSVPHEKNETGKELICALTNDMQIAVLDSSTGDLISSVSNLHDKESTAISIYILAGAKCITEVSGGEYIQFLSQEDKEVAEVSHVSGIGEGDSDRVNRSTNFVQNTVDLQILLCCTDVLLLYSLKSMMQGHADSICEVPLLKTSCWTSIFKKNDEDYGLLIFYQTGSIEIRSLPNLEVLGELSLLSILRWNFRTNMDKTMSCTEKGQITLVNGCEFVILSLLACENDFRIPESLPCLYDEALTAALDLNFSPNQKTNKESSSGILGGIMRGLRTSKEAQSTEPVETSKSLRSVFNKVFSSSKPKASAAEKDVGEVMELKIDDIEIDGPLLVSPKPHKSEGENKDKSAERKKLFEGGTSEAKPRQRTIEEIKAKYKKAGIQLLLRLLHQKQKNKLLERQEKLERIGQNSEELRNSAENFSSMAKQLAKKMENRK